EPREERQTGLKDGVLEDFTVIDCLEQDKPCMGGYGGLKENGPQREQHYQDVWLVGRSMTLRVGFEVSFAQASLSVTVS
ncbi:hypothetical protein ACQP3J_33545, partial [Escherichia coli]